MTELNASHLIVVDAAQVSGSNIGHNLCLKISMVGGVGS